MFFVVLLGGSLYIFFTTGWHKMPNEYLPPYHRYTLPVSIALPIVSFIAASVTDPGRIHPGNVSECLKMFPFDNVLFQRGAVCSTCRIPKPARSKHCSLCNKCVMRVDHHCSWVNNCVGHRNHPHFVAFLLSINWLCVYGGYVVFWLTMYNMQRLGLVLHLHARGLMSARYVWPIRQPNGEAVVVDVGFWKALSAVLLYEPLLTALCVFLPIAALVVFAFNAQHFHSAIWQGRTTNEVHKWQHVRELIKAGELEFYDDGRGGYVCFDRLDGPPEQQQPSQTAGQAQQVRHRKGKTKSKVPQDRDAPVVPRNMYDRGILGNIREIVLPGPTPR
ncbi:hypothetical protein RI367_001713 [Sorochytrium milnesiophthora]